jgi:hypothetical protein
VLVTTRVGNSGDAFYFTDDELNVVVLRQTADMLAFDQVRAFRSVWDTYTQTYRRKYASGTILAVGNASLGDAVDVQQSSRQQRVTQLYATVHTTLTARPRDAHAQAEITRLSRAVVKAAASGHGGDTTALLRCAYAVCMGGSGANAMPVASVERAAEATCARTPMLPAPALYRSYGKHPMTR